MTFRLSKDNNEAFLGEQYKGRWVAVGMAGSNYYGKLDEVDQRHNCLFLSPYLHVRQITPSLPPHASLVKDGREAIFYDNSPFALTPITQEGIEEAVREIQRDFDIASKEREKQLASRLENLTKETK